MPQITLTTINKMIEDAFGDEKLNIVNFELIASVLYLLARRLNLLQRHFFVEYEDFDVTPKPKISVTEIKIEAKVPKQPKLQQDSKEAAEKKMGKSGKQLKQQSKTSVTEKQSKKPIKRSLPSSEPSVSSEHTKRSKDKKHKDVSESSSSDSTRPRHEKLLVLETRRSQDSSVYSGSKFHTTRSLATKEQYEALKKSVAGLSKRYGASESQDMGLSKNMKEELYKEVSFTDPVAVLKLASRLEVVERQADEMLQLLMDIRDFKQDEQAQEFERAEEAKQREREKAEKQAEIQGSQKIYTFGNELEASRITNLLKKDDMIIAMDDVSNEVARSIKNIENKSNAAKETVDAMMRDPAMKLAASVPKLMVDVNHLEGSLTAFGNRARNVEAVYEKQMRGHQDNINSMKDDFQEVYDAAYSEVTNTEGNSADIDILNALLIGLGNDMLALEQAQYDLKNHQALLKQVLERLKKDVRKLERTKISREGADQLLAGKVGVEEINQSPTKPYFAAVKGYLEKCILQAYDKFNSQELNWQKIIDDTQKHINNIADKHTLDMFSMDVDFQIKQLNKFLNYLTLGESSTVKARRLILRDGPCLSCGANIHDQMFPSADGDHKAVGIKLSKKLTEHVEKSEPFRQKCFPGFPIPHPPHLSYPKAPICRVPRMCGDVKTTSHPALTLPSPVVLKLRRDPKPKEQEIPCVPCNEKEFISQLHLRQVRKHDVSRRNQPDPAMCSENKYPAAAIVVHVGESLVEIR